MLCAPTIASTWHRPAGQAASVPRELRVNTTSATSDSVVRVDWSAVLAGANVSDIPPLHIAWSRVAPDPGAHASTTWRVLPSRSARSFWVGQFSPALTSASQVSMQPFDPTMSEGTPPWTVPMPVKFLSGAQLSAGHYDFRVTNMRSTVGWALFEGSLTSAAGFRVLALSPEVRFADADAPMHLRLARTSSTTQMRVSWTWSPAGARPDAQVRSAHKDPPHTHTHARTHTLCFRLVSIAHFISLTIHLTLNTYCFWLVYSCSDRSTKTLTLFYSHHLAHII